jgi:copper chaperone NosL
MKTLIGFFLTLVLSSCSKGFEPITYGKDACAHCKMTIVDNRYAAGLVTPKGKTYKFDDLSCLEGFTSEQKIDVQSRFYVCNFMNPGEILAAEHAVFLKHDFFQSPMNGHYAAFSSAADAGHLSDSLGVTPLNWENIK